MKPTLSSAADCQSILCGVLFAALTLGCSTPGDGSPVGGDGPGTGGGGPTGGGNPSAGASGPGTAGNINLGGLPPGQDGPCSGLECEVPKCEAGTTTTISGKVFDPAGKLPLYNVLVYVPNGPLPPFTDGISCDRCATSVSNPVTSTITDENGAFKLTNAPAGQEVPIVFQVGKWRRQIKVAASPCTETALTDVNQTRLPRDRTEGDIPRIAIAAGGADAMECFPRRLGISDSEFTTSAGDGRIHLYTATDSRYNDLSVKAFDASLNGGAALPHSTELWQDIETLKKYDIVVLSCEGDTMASEKPMPSREALYEYLSLGGRVFASHFHHIWFSGGPQAVQSVGTWRTRTDPLRESGTLPATVDQSFPKGAALAQWLVNVGASTTLGTLDVNMPRDNIQAVDPMLAREWITLENPRASGMGMSKSVQYMSFNAPVGAPEEEVCGRAVFTGLHVSTTVEDEEEQPPGFPLSCTGTELSPEEKAVAFMLFDLSSCVQSDEKPPQIPK